MTLDLAQFHESFFEESFEALDAMEAALLKLDVGVADHDGINTIFRGAHSMKGGAAMLGFADVTSFTHTLETLLDELRSGKMQVSAPTLDCLLKSVDVLREMLTAVRAKKPVDAQRVADLQFDLEAIVARKDAAPPVVAPAAAAAQAGAPATLAAATGQVVVPAGSAATAGHAAAPAASAAHAAAPAGSAATAGHAAAPAASAAAVGHAAAPATAATAGGQIAAPATPAGATNTGAGGTVSAPAGQPPSSSSEHAAAADAGWIIEFKPLPHLLLQGNDPLAIFAALKELGRVEASADLSVLPPVAKLDPQICYVSWQLHLHGDCSREQVEETFDWTTGDCELHIERPGGARSPGEVAVGAAPSEAGATVGAIAGPASASGAAAAPTAAAASTAGAAPPAQAAPAPTGADHSKQVTAESGSIRVGIDKIDELINTVGELVITQAMLSELGRALEGSAAELLRSGLSQLERNMRQLQESVMRVRMLPISVAFSRFPRMVRDLAQRLNKKVELKLAGEQTELDKTVLEKIGDPLVHLVRNSIDHGIEIPEIRTAAGKAPFGTISLNAYHTGGHIAVEVADDGAGLDKARILAKARSRGLVGANDVLTDDQIHDLIFLPGFSTAEKTTDVSGRGVGMDVVKQRVKELGGSVEISSERGHGSRFLITLPLTLSIVDGQSVLVGGETYIVPLTSIIESLQLKPQNVNRLSGACEVFSFRGDYLPLVRLYDLFGIEPRSRALQEGLVVVAEGDGKRVGLFVDELLGQQQVVIKSMESNYGHIEGISGATILGDGSVALILDVPGLIRAASMRVAA